ncbi:MAG: IS66 family transposase, partial [Paracoccus sp. (in: a-proteobacteria)]
MSDAALEITRLRAALAAETARAKAAESELLQVRATISCSEAMIKELKLEIAKLRRDKYGVSSERSKRLLEQLELQLEELEAAATEDTLAAEDAQDATTTTVQSFTRRKPSRKPIPEPLPREREEVTAPTHCDSCASRRIVKIGEDLTKTHELVPR